MKMKIAYSHMIGDLFNYGHLKALEKARKVSDMHICGVITDEVARKWTSPLVCSFEERKAVIEQIDYVDHAWRQDSLDPTENLKKIHRKYPHATILLMQSHHLWQGTLGSDYLEQIGGEVIKTDFYHSLSRDYMLKVFYNFFVERKQTANRFEGLCIADVSFFRESFTTKANTLQKLRKVLTNADIERLFVFTVRQWQRSKRSIIAEIAQRFDKRTIVVRSSSLAEDALESSNAGHFHSELDVSASDQAIVTAAVERVVDSYRQGNSFSPDDQILVQEQTEQVAISGVVFTRNLESNTPYYLINYDDSTPRTDTVTGGMASGKLEIFRGTPQGQLEPRWRKLMTAVREIESFFQGISLDIEFAIRKDKRVVIFQVRPLAANSKFYSLADDQLLERIQRCTSSYRSLADSDQHQLLLSDMAFWNPAELIGDRPDYLAYSLFNHLIMKQNWNTALRPLGYAPVNEGLMVRISNKPYVHVARAFHSLLPASLPEELATRLVDFYLKKLEHHPHLHDKIEFEVVHNCFTFDQEQRLAELGKAGFSAEEISFLADELKLLTVGMIRSFDAVTEEDSRAIEQLAQIVCDSDKPCAVAGSWRQRLLRVYDLIESCRQMGIPAFVRAARAAFVSSALLRSLCRTGDLSTEDISSLMNSVETVATELDRDMDQLVTGRMQVSVFLERYGHLRPGTYDITKPSYAGNPDYLAVSPHAATHGHGDGGTETAFDAAGVTHILDLACTRHKLPFDGTFLLSFIRRSIQLREYYKFVYTRNISHSLELIAQVGAEFGFDRHELSRLDYPAITAGFEYYAQDELIDTWRSLISGRMTDEQVSGLVSLPSLICSKNDFMVVQHRTASPNFVTEQSIEADLVVLESFQGSSNEISGKIIVIEKADPGYDWIFTKGISGLVTKYGGAASHMAIRAAEFGIPAAIGCGEIIFDRIALARRLLMDCKKRLLHPIGQNI
jgi:glutamine kinase